MTKDESVQYLKNIAYSNSHGRIRYVLTLFALSIWLFYGTNSNQNDVFFYIVFMLYLSFDYSYGRKEKKMALIMLNEIERA